MARRERRSKREFEFFEPPGPSDPIGSFLSIVGNEACNLGLQHLMRKLPGLMGIEPFPEDPVRRRR